MNKSSKLPISQQISWLQSHASGVMKVRTLNGHEEDFWQVVLNVATEAASLRRLLNTYTEKIGSQTTPPAAAPASGSAAADGGRSNQPHLLE